MNIHLFMCGDRGVKVYEALIKEGYQVKKVYLPKGNKYIINTKNKSILSSTIYYISKNELNAISENKKSRPELYIVAGFPMIFPKKLIDFPKYFTVNLHAGKVPKYRGGSPLNWQIIEGEKRAGISVLQMDEGIDSGPVLAKESIAIKNSTTIMDLHNHANILFPKLLIKVIKKIKAKKLKIEYQNNKNAIYWHQRSDRDGKINFNTMNSKDIDFFVRSITFPYPGSWVWYKEKKLRIYMIKIIDKIIKGTPGRICWIEGQGPLVICKDKAICLLKYSYDNGEAANLNNNDFLE